MSSQKLVELSSGEWLDVSTIVAIRRAGGTREGDWVIDYAVKPPLEFNLSLRHSSWSGMMMIFASPTDKDLIVAKLREADKKSTQEEPKTPFHDEEYALNVIDETTFEIDGVEHSIGIKPLNN